MLGRGIITWDDITHTIDATCELPPRYFTDALDKIEQMWNSVDESLRKLSINSMIGLFSNSISHTYICKTKEPGFDDTLFEGTKRMRILQEFGLEQVVLEHELVSNACMTPIHMQIIDSELLMLARMRNALVLHCGLTLRHIKESRVDSCLIQAGNKREDEVIEKIQQFTRSMREDDFKKAKILELLAPHNGSGLIPSAPATAQDGVPEPKCFRAEQLGGEKLERTRLRGHYKLPVTNAVAPEDPLEWTWHTPETAMEAVLNGQSVYISGIGGTGKSYNMKRMVKALQENNVKVMILAKCHVATLNAGQGLPEKTAMTAQAFVHQFNIVGGLAH